MKKLRFKIITALFILVMLNVGLLVYNYKNNIASYIVSKYTETKMKNSLSIDSVRNLCSNKIVFDRFILKKDYKKAGFLELELESPILHFNFLELLKKQRFKYFSFKDPAFSFKDTFFKNFPVNSIFMSKFLENKICLKGIKGFIKSTTNNNGDIVVLYNKNVILKGFSDTRKNSSNCTLRINNATFENKDGFLEVCPDNKGNFSGEGSLSFNKDIIKANLERIFINENDFSLKGNLNLEYDLKSGLTFLSQVDILNNFIASSVTTNMDSKKINFQGTINRIFAKNLEQDIEYHMEASISEEFVFQGVIGNKKRAYISGGFDELGSLILDVTLKSFLLTGENINFKLKIRENYKVFSYKIELFEFYAGNRKLPNLSLDINYKNNNINIKNLKWGNSSCTGDIDLIIAKDVLVNAKFGFNAFDLDLLKSFGFNILKGTVNGNFVVSGNLKDLKGKGKLNIKQGTFHETVFEKAEVPFLYEKGKIILKDVRMFKDKDIFTFNGDIDFSKKNPFKDVKVKTKGKVLVWDGWRIGKDNLSDEFKMEKKISDDLSIRYKKMMNNDDLKQELNSVLELEYGLSENDKVFVSFEGENNCVGYKKKYDF